VNITLISNPIGQNHTFMGIDTNVREALNAVLTVGNQFVVNTDSARWYMLRNGKLKPCVMNRAEFISGTFQKRLRELGWKTDHLLNNQEIDGYVEFPGHVRSYAITRQNLLSLIGQYWNENPKADVAELMADLYHGYYLRSGADLTGIEPGLRKYFDGRSLWRRSERLWWAH